MTSEVAAEDVNDGEDAEVIELLPHVVSGSSAAGVEALLIGALVWASAAEVVAIAEWVDANDLYQPSMGTIYEIIVAQARAGRSHRPEIILAELERRGRLTDPAAGNLVRALTDASLMGASPEALREYADAVLAASYRRGYRADAAAIADAAEGAPEEYLFDRLLEVGRRQRTAWTRLNAFRATIGGAK